MDSLLPFFSIMFLPRFFTLTNPLGTMPVFLTMTNGMSEEQRRAIVPPRHNRVVPDADGFHFLRAVPVASFSVFRQTGSVLLGGIIIFTIGFDMLQARYAKAKLKEEEAEDICERHFHYAPCHPDALRAGCDRQCLDADGRCRDIGKEMHLDRDDRIDLFYHLPDPPRFHTSEPLHGRDGQ